MKREDYLYRGKKFTRFTKGSVEYTYSHDTGNMNMRRPGKWGAQAIMDRKDSRAKGVLPGVANDPDYAEVVASNHFNNYKPRRV